MILRMKRLSQNGGETIELCSRVMHEIVAKDLSNHLPESRKLAEDAVDGLWYSDVSLNKNAMLALMHNMTGLECSYHLSIFNNLSVVLLSSY